MNLRDALQGIYEQHGRLTPALVVDEARQLTHPLHSRFEWDDAVAGEEYRRVQAAELIRSVKVVYKEATETEPEKKVRAWQAVREESRYVPVAEAAADPNIAAIILADAQREWRALYRRYAHLSEFVEMVRADLTRSEPEAVSA